jgi:hypothetical protein
MDVEVLVEQPTGVAETLDCWEGVPFGAFCVVDFKGNCLSDLIGSTADYKHQSLEEDC